MRKGEEIYKWNFQTIETERLIENGNFRLKTIRKGEKISKWNFKTIGQCRIIENRFFKSIKTEKTGGNIQMELSNYRNKANDRKWTFQKQNYEKKGGNIQMELSNYRKMELSDKKL